MDLTEAVWRKSSYTGPNGGDCVELTSAARTVALRDSKDPDGPKLLVSRRAFAALLSDLKR
jgi:hypothetical protein